jgi:hypothetical protein
MGKLAIADCRLPIANQRKLRLARVNQRGKLPP